MWFWYNTPCMPLWWIFPVMAGICFLIMFFLMRRCLSGRSLWCGFGSKGDGPSGGLGKEENAVRGFTIPTPMSGK